MGFLLNKILGGKTSGEASNDETQETETVPFSFVDDNYTYPTLYDELDEMLQVSLLMYPITDLRALAKNNKKGGGLLKTPEKILDLPITLETALTMIEENLDLIKEEMGDHEMAMSALQSIQERYDRHNNMTKTTTATESSSSSSNNNKGWLNPWSAATASSTAAVQQQQQHSQPPFLTAFGDENSTKELVYAVGVDPVRKRVTVAFRGSVTPTDFVTDAIITLNKRENPLKDVDGQETHIGIHHGFDEYLLKRRKVLVAGGSCKFDEIMEHVKELFQDDDRRQNYKLYCTGHSLGGALSTLFAFEAAAITAATSSSDDLAAAIIPTPVTVVSVASPRVGGMSFQKAFRYLEKTGKLRHLRIANAGDPVTIMPKSSSKKLFAMLSPISYLAFTLQDQDFADRETYRHTGLKLKLNRSKGKKDEPLYELSYDGLTSAKEELEKDDEDSDDVTKSGEQKKKSSWLTTSTSRDVPNVAYHFGTCYTQRAKQVKEELTGMTLNDLYLSLAQANSTATG